jgi:hypothetical protein
VSEERREPIEQDNSGKRGITISPRPEPTPDRGFILGVIFTVCIMAFILAVVRGWPLLIREGLTTETIAIIATIIISQVIGWRIERSSYISGIVTCSVVAAIIAFILMIVAIFALPGFYIGHDVFAGIVNFLLGVLTIAGMSIVPSILFGLPLFIYRYSNMKSRVKRNPLRSLIIDIVKSAREIDSDLKVLVEHDKVSILTKSEQIIINYNEHGYANIDDMIKKILIKDIIETSLGSDYKYKRKQNTIEKRSPGISKENNTAVKYKDW